MDKQWRQPVSKKVLVTEGEVKAILAAGDIGATKTAIMTAWPKLEDIATRHRLMCLAGGKPPASKVEEWLGSVERNAIALLSAMGVTACQDGVIENEPPIILGQYLGGRTKVMADVAVIEDIRRCAAKGKKLAANKVQSQSNMDSETMRPHAVATANRAAVANIDRLFADLTPNADMRLTKSRQGFIKAALKVMGQDVTERQIKHYWAKHLQ